MSITNYKSIIPKFLRIFWARWLNKALVKLNLDSELDAKLDVSSHTPRTKANIINEENKLMKEQIHFARHFDFVACGGRDTNIN